MNMMPDLTEYPLLDKYYERRIKLNGFLTMTNKERFYFQQGILESGSFFKLYKLLKIEA